MYLLQVEADFSAALYLSDSGEKFKGMHGHDYNVVLTLSSSELNRAGMVYDYDVVQQSLKKIVNKLDHCLLNDIAEFIEQNPTLENIASYIFNEMKTTLEDLPLYDVKVTQSKGFSAIYRPENPC